MKSLPGRCQHPLVRGLGLVFFFFLHIGQRQADRLFQVRTHPVTNLKCLYYNPASVTHIPELKAQESAHTLNFLREHLHEADDLSVRWHWTTGSVAFWDNRTVAHRAIPGGYDKDKRQGKRSSVYGERPFYDPNSQVWDL